MKNFYDVNTVKVAGNVVRNTKVYQTKNGVHFAFIHLATHAGKYTTWVEAIAWKDLADKLAKVTKGQKIEIKAHLGNGRDTTQHGDKVQTLMPVVNKFRVLHFNKKNKASNQNSNQQPKASQKPQQKTSMKVVADNQKQEKIQNPFE